MTGEIKTLIKHGSIYTFGTIVGRIASFLLIPIYTKYLNPAEYGILELLSMTVEIISTIIGIGMTSAIMRFYYKYDDEESRKKVVSSAFIGTITIMGITSAACLLLASNFSNLVFSSEDYAGYFRVIFLNMFLSSGIEIPMVLLRAKLKSKKYVAISIIKLIMQLTLNIYFLVVLKLGVFGILYSTLIATAIISLYLTIVTFRETGLRFSYGHYRDMLKFGAPLIISDFSVFILTYADRYFLNYYCDLTIVGIYSLAYKFGMLVSMLFAAPFRAIWGAGMFQYAKQENATEVFASVMNYFLMGSLAISLFFALFTKDILYFMADPAYWGAYKIVPIISSAYVIGGVISITGAGIMIHNKTKYKALSTSMGMIVNTVLNFIFIPFWGAYGAAVATLVAFAVRFGVDTYYSQKLFKINYDIKKILNMVVIYAILTAQAYLWNIENIAISIMVHTISLVLFPILLYFSGVITAENKDLIFSLIRNPSGVLKLFNQKSA